MGWLSKVDLLAVTDVRKRHRLAHVEPVIQRAAADRLPVLDGMPVLGILSREDVLGHLYEEAPC